MGIKQNKNNRQATGFTLIEILVAVGLLAIIAVIGSNMFFTTLRNSTKSKTLTTVKQNGDYALATIERLIRDSEKVITNSDGSLCAVGMNKIKTRRVDGSEVEFSCEEEGTANGLIASNSARLTSNEVKLDSCSFDCSSRGGFYPQVVTINFTLSQAAVTTRPEEQASVSFKTTVTTRNF